MLTRRILLEKLWDNENNFVDEHTLTVNINRIRSKIGEFLRLSLSQTEKLEFLIVSLAKMSRLENGAISFSPVRLPAIEIIADGLAQIMPFAEQKNILVEADCREDVFVFCDKKWTSEAAKNVDGFGLGLFLSRQIVSGQNSFITIQSEPARGAKFIINLPMK